jgi:hypothetical protein
LQRAAQGLTKRWQASEKSSQKTKTVKRREPHPFETLKSRCVLCQGTYIVQPWRIFAGRLTVPLCVDCQREHGSPARDTITPVVEARMQEIFAVEKAFWHPGEIIEPGKTQIGEEQ